MMKNWLKQILAVLLLIPFLMSTTGFVFYKSFCSCTGNSKVSIYVAAETCSSHGSSEMVKMDTESCCSSQVSQCSIHNSSCECDTPNVTYVKLDSKVINATTSFVFSADKIEFVQWNIDKERLAELFWKKNTFLAYIEPPPKFTNQNDYLNLICQLKLPEIT